MTNRRVVITGLGLITPLGNDVESSWENLCLGKSGISRVEDFDTSDLNSKIAGQIKNFDVLDYLDKKEARKLDRYVHLAVAATEQAIKQSQLNLNNIDCSRVGVITGSGIGGIETFEKQCLIHHKYGARRVSPFFIPMMISNIGAGQLAIRYSAKGKNFNIVSACASGTHAIGEAFNSIRSGEVDIILAGGSEAAITKFAFAGFCAMKALSTRNDEPERASRPFDKGRDGFIMSEGAGFMIIENYETAKKRDAHILAEIVGYGASADAFHITAPAEGGEGAALAMTQALKHANIKPEYIDYINAHGTSTPLNDKFETIAIKTVFGEHSKKLKISSTKSMLGHGLGSAGAIEAIVLVKTLQTGIIPPTINYENPDPECDLDYTPNVKFEKECKYVMSNSFGFGGHNGVIVMKKYEY